MVEPQKQIFAELVSMNEGCDIVFEQLAIAERECERTLYKISFSNAGWATTLASFDKKTIEVSRDNGWIERCATAEGVALPKRPEDYYCSEKVQCTTLRKLLDKHHFNYFDLLIIDTEGYDLEIIGQMAELEVQPRVVLFEHKYFSLVEFKECVRLLRSCRYQLYGDGSNTIGLRPRAAEISA